MLNVNSTLDQLLTLKKRLLVVTLFIRMFISGAEYSVILPTALIYVTRLDGSYFFQGLVVAIYPMGAILSLPVFGYLYDKTKRFKELLLVLNAFQVIGNVLYALPFSKWCPIIGRFIGGLGDGVIACAAGEITHLYSVSARIGILSLLEVGRVFGLMIGPTLNAFIGQSNFKLIVHSWIFDEANLPGVAMAGAWFIMELITICCVFNVAKEIEELKRKSREILENEEPSSDEEKVAKEPVATKSTDDLTLIYTDYLYEKEEVDSFEQSSNDLDSLFSEGSVNLKTKSYWRTVFHSCFSIEFVVIFYADIVLWFVQTQFEILMPYVTEFDYGWNPNITSYIYVGGGGELLIIFLLLYSLSSRFPVRDSYFLLFALILTQMALALLILESEPYKRDIKIGLFFTVCALAFTAIPFNLVCSRNLAMKMFPAESQGTIQGLYSSASRLAMVCGPIIISFLFERRQAYGAVASVACFVAILCLFSSLNGIKARIDLMQSLKD